MSTNMETGLSSGYADDDPRFFVGTAREAEPLPEAEVVAQENEEPGSVGTDATAGIP